ncbi:MAG: GTPase ObgE [Alistipes sp.]|nr:GTPase ObgE [Rikenellaceae bacterium]MBQ6881442.1 GTPase ObgE [Alistipes sp.]MBR3847220.1 GTPase ObgE [Alistipes sp.]MBR7169040.1 GTPase ObgE [Alistipes sp.]
MAGSNFVDYVKIFARSGHGGAGSAHFRREKFVAFGGPDGGDGGKGGSIILQGDRQYWTLIHLKYQRHQFAEDGECGSGARSSGKNAKDIILPVPLGTVAHRLVLNEETGEEERVYVGEVTEHGEQLVLLQGGRGGLGNWHFKSATNQVPRYAQPGEEGDEGSFVLELKVLADVGLVGFPNAGKSTLLSVVSAAKPKIANYAFTTLEPNLGIVEVRDHKSFVMADIPGIIEGAHEGKGLGTRFLRHIERNSVLLFMVAADSENIREAYEVLLGELTQYNPELLDKQRLLAITKCDMLGNDEELLEQLRAELPEGVPSIFISSVAGKNIQQLKDMLWKALTDSIEG